MRIGNTQTGAPYFGDPTIERHSGGTIESHHDGNFAGGLKSNEVFAKLLEGEYIATETKMNNFMKNILPRMVSYNYGVSGENGNIVVNMPINVEGDFDKKVVPDIEQMTQRVIQKINNALEVRGIRRTATSFGI